MFQPLLPAEYDVTEFSGQTDAPEVRCGLTKTLTDRRTDTDNYSNPRCACAHRGLTRLMKHVEMAMSHIMETRCSKTEDDGRQQ